MQSDCLKHVHVKGRVVGGTVYGDMNLKDLLGSIKRVGYCITVLDFHLRGKKILKFSLVKFLLVL